MRLIKLILLVLLLTGCSNIDRKLEWRDSKQSISYVDKLKTGDIIIKNKVWYSPITWFGHSGVMVNKTDIGEYPKIGIGYNQLNAKFWLYDERNIIILRYKYFDEKFKERFLINISKNKDKMYRISLDKNDNKSFYCSKYVWYLFYKTAKELGYDLKPNTNIKNIILPYDFFYLEDFEQILLF